MARFLISKLTVEEMDMLLRVTIFWGLVGFSINIVKGDCCPLD